MTLLLCISMEKRFHYSQAVTGHDVKFVRWKHPLVSVGQGLLHLASLSFIYIVSGTVCL